VSLNNAEDIVDGAVGPGLPGIREWTERHYELVGYIPGFDPGVLDLPDNDLWDIVAGRSDSYEPHLNDVVVRLRAA